MASSPLPGPVIPGGPRPEPTRRDGEEREAAPSRAPAATGGVPRLVVLEYFAAGGRLPDGNVDAMRREGEAMLRALLADLAELPLPRLAAVVRPGFRGSLPPGVERVAGGPEPAAALARALAGGGGWSWIVGPETRGVLERLTAAARRLGAGTVGTPARGVRRAAHRLALLRRLHRAGVPVPATLPAPTDRAARRAMEELGPPVVVKPGRGAGAAGTRRVDDPADLRRARSAALSVDPGLPPLVQRFVPGTAASVSLLVAGERVDPLALSGQRVRFAPGARYLGGFAPLRHPHRPRALRSAVAAARACGGLRGLAGVDLVLGTDGPVVLEVNPRLTTSYLGLRERPGPAPALAALRASGCPAGGERPATSRRGSP